MPEHPEVEPNDRKSDIDIEDKERLHRESYTFDPIQPDEFEDWSEVQAWGEDEEDNKEN